MLKKLIKKRNKEIKEQKNRIEKYWKLLPSERMDYDVRIRRIYQSTSFGLKDSFSFLSIKLSFWLMVFFSVFNYFFNNLITSELIISEQSLILTLFSLIVPFILLDIVLLIIFSFRRDKSIKELNKRFKI